MRAGLVLALLLLGCGGTPDDAWAELTAPTPPGFCPLGEDCGSPGSFTLAPADAGTTQSPSNVGADELDASPSIIGDATVIDGGSP